MPSSTASKTNIRILAVLLSLAILYLLVAPAHSPKSDVATTPTEEHGTSRFGIDTSFIKSAGQKFTNALSGSNNQDIDSEFNEEDEVVDDEETTGEEHHVVPEEATDEPVLTDEEKAVQEYHQKHGQDQPTRDHPNIAFKGESETQPASVPMSSAVDEGELTEEEQAVQDHHKQHGQDQPTRDRPKVPSKEDVQQRRRQRRYRIQQ